MNPFKLSANGLEWDVDPTGCALHRSNRTFKLGTNAYHFIRQQLVGQGHGDTHFVLIWGNDRIEGCTIDQEDGVSGTIGYLTVGPV